MLFVENLSKKFFRARSPSVKDVTFELHTGDFLALVGESGCGKTTLLRLIAGFETPDFGKISIGGSTVCDNRVFVEPERRGVAMVFQDYALFPHLNVVKNVGFGLSRLRSRERENRIAEMLELVELTGYETRYPHQLSGGQQQRVALARALAPRPSLLLLDEPFSNLDESLRAQVRDDIRQILERAETTVLLVTHDTKDALSLARRIALMKEGSLLQLDSTESIYNQPQSCYAARYFGQTNILRAKPIPNGFETRIGIIDCEAANQLTGSVCLSIRPEHFRLVQNGGSKISGTVAKVTFKGEYQEVKLRIVRDGHDDEELIVNAAAGMDIRLNDTLFVLPQKEKIQIIEEPEGPCLAG